jgi:hypothetical protein
MSTLPWRTSSHREETRKSNKRKTVMMISLVLQTLVRHLRNRKPGNKNYPWHYDESTRSSEIQ